ncbi:hypothetical protein K439DRAFT_1640773 [Ramaria rubella]|nr:hypothetical protein K439DRAFT_1640773 [Ramaria rubella]
MTDFLSTLSRTSVAAVLLMRTYAIHYYHSAFSLAIITVLGIIATSITILDLFQLSFDGCEVRQPSQAGIKANVANSIIRVVFDTAIIALTLSKLAPSPYKHNLAITNSNNLITKILRNSAYYFGVVFILELSNSLVFWLASPSFKGVISSLPLPLSSILISRFLLDLRQSDVDPWTTSESLDSMSTLRFELGVNNLTPLVQGSDIETTLLLQVWEDPVMMPRRLS